MKRVVLKFGGTSVADAESRQAVAAIIRDTKEICGELIVVVSAMGRKGAPYATDTLLQVYGDGQDLPKNREQDMIYACGEIISGSVLAQELNTQGLRSVFLTGGQAGIETDDHYSEANILTVHTDRLKKWLAQDYIIIVAGGQGMTASGEAATQLPARSAITPAPTRCVSIPMWMGYIPGTRGSFKMPEKFPVSAIVNVTAWRPTGPR